MTDANTSSPRGLGVGSARREFVQSSAWLAASASLLSVSNQLKRSVRFDDPTERFVSDDEANRFLKREYRQPYVVPEEV